MSSTAVDKDACKVLIGVVKAGNLTEEKTNIKNPFQT